MADRASFDKPAILILCAAGVLLAGVSAPFLQPLYCKSPAANCATGTPEQPVAFDVAWTETAGSPLAATLSGNAGHAVVNVTVTAALTSALHVRIGSCKDAHNAAVGQQAVGIDWSVSRAAAGAAPQPVAGASGHAACDGKDFAIDLPRQPHPDVAAVRAADQDAAARALAADGKVANATETATYLLDLRWSRPGPLEPPVPVPGVSTSFSGQATLSADAWAWTLTLHPVEVQK